MVNIKSQALSQEEIREIRQRAMQRIREIEKELIDATGEKRARLLTMKIAEENLADAMRYALEYIKYAKRWGLPEQEFPPVPSIEDLKKTYPSEDDSWSRIVALRDELSKIRNRIYKLKEKKEKGVYGKVLLLNYMASLLRRELRLHYLIIAERREKGE